MKFGLTDLELKILYEKVIQPLKSNGCSVYIFGSRATGKQKLFSDVDVLFVPKPHPGIQDHTLFLIRESIENSTFPYKVDLANLYELAPSYRDQVLKNKIEV